ncbi:MAG TPA: DPP IV N-terminal domain-containing protein, partial [Chthonomonadales bacterium]|nr:DPP IV N-terminal domain-containing protein [Chthonomonadales bacterium]
CGAQGYISQLAGYQRYKQLEGKIPSSVQRVSLDVQWLRNGADFLFQQNGKVYQYDVSTLRATEAPAGTEIHGGGSGFGGFAFPGLERGRQMSSLNSPDGRWRAFYKDSNLWLAPAAGKGAATPITTDGSEAARIKYGTASWVYGEELEQRTAFWWSPDSRKLAFYRFNEKDVKDYYVPMDQLRAQDQMNAEPFPIAGAPNPIPDILIYDLKNKATITADVRNGQPFANSVVGYYVYGVQWTKDSSALLFHRTNRRQNIMDLAACNPDNGKCRVVVREQWPESWTDNSPRIQFLKDGKRFILTSERTGFRNLYLYDLSGTLLATLTAHPYDVESIVRVDENAGLVYYMARSGDNYMKLQLHRVKLDGAGEVRLTDPSLNHTVDIAPDGLHFIDMAQTHDSAPSLRLVDSQGKVLDTFARSDTSGFGKLNLRPVELFTYKAADGVTDLYGMLNFPSNFDPQKKYPLLVSVYAGPETSGANEYFHTPSPLTEMGFLVASLDSRSSGGRGKKFLDAIYEKLGTVEIDDQAAGVKSLCTRPYVDASRVGIFGTSYGGYASLMALLRYPDLFRAASAASPVTDWRDYDTVYTERYMWLPQENKEGYDAGSAMTYAKNLKGRLMIYFGTSDNNVHNGNSLQLIQAL